MVAKGDKVIAGQAIGASGNSGRSTGPHLHFGIYKNGVAQNPSNYVKYDSSVASNKLNTDVLEISAYYVEDGPGGPEVDGSEIDSSRVSETEYIEDATTTGRCRDFKPINWYVGTVYDSSYTEASTTSGPPTPGDATGVLASMQNFYREGGLKGPGDSVERKDKWGHAWTDIRMYPSSAQYALDNYKTVIVQTSQKYGVDPAYVVAKMAFESGGGKTTGWGTGAAAGPMQIEKKVHENKTISAYNVITKATESIFMSREAMSDTNTNIEIGIMMYANKLKDANGNPFISAQMYNFGTYGASSCIKAYANRTGKTFDNIKVDYNDVGWLYDLMVYHNTKEVGDPFYAYKFAMYVDWLEGKV